MLVQHLRCRILDYGSGEEAWIHPGLGEHRVRKHKVTKILLGDKVVLDQLPCFLRGIAHIRQIVMAQVGTVDNIEPCAECVFARVEGQRGHRIIALAAEEEVRHEQVFDVCAPFHSAERPFVDLLGLFLPAP